MRRREYKPFHIDVLPSLSIVLIVMKLVVLICMVMTIRIAVSSRIKRAIPVPSPSAAQMHLKRPTYLDCHPDHIVIYPGAQVLNWPDLQSPDNQLELRLLGLESEGATDYIQIVARPRSQKFFRTVRKIVRDHPGIEFDTDIIPEGMSVDNFQPFPPTETK